MRRGWMRVSGWALATGAMIGLSWYGVHSVLHPNSVASQAEYASDGLPGDPPVAATASVSSAASASASAAARSASPSPSPSATASARPTVQVTPRRSPSPTAPPAGVDRTYAVEGGRAVFDIGTSSATLVSATPDPGWSAQEWRQSDWIRVIFKDNGQSSDDQDKISVITCSWAGHPPTVQTYTS
jgi:hypothetical protein